MYHIESIAKLPSDKTGYAITFFGSFTSGRIDALGRVKGLYYKGVSPAPAVRFSLALAPEDPSTICFSCEGCTDIPLMQRELLLLLKGIDFVPQDLKKLPFPKQLHDAKGPATTIQPATAG